MLCFWNVLVNWIVLKVSICARSRPIVTIYRVCKSKKKLAEIGSDFLRQVRCVSVRTSRSRCGRRSIDCTIFWSRAWFAWAMKNEMKKKLKKWKKKSPSRLFSLKISMLILVVISLVFVVCFVVGEPCKCPPADLKKTKVNIFIELAFFGSFHSWCVVGFGNVNNEKNDKNDSARPERLPVPFKHLSLFFNNLAKLRGSAVGFCETRLFFYYYCLSPGALVFDLDNDGQNELIACYYDVFVHRVTTKNDLSSLKQIWKSDQGKAFLFVAIRDMFSHRSRPCACTMRCGRHWRRRHGGNCSGQKKRCMGLGMERYCDRNTNIERR